MKKQKVISEFFKPSTELPSHENETSTLSNMTDSSGLLAAVDNQAPCGNDSTLLANSPFHPDGSFTFPTAIAPNQKWYDLHR